MDEKLKILLCEDDENLGMLLREYLAAKGYMAELCPDGEAGYKAFLKGTCQNLVLERGTKSYTVSGKVRLSAGVSVVSAISSVMNFDPSLYTVNVSLLLIHEDGRKESIIRKGVPVSRFIKGENLSE